MHLFNICNLQPKVILFLTGTWVLQFFQAVPKFQYAHFYIPATYPSSIMTVLQWSTSASSILSSMSTTIVVYAPIVVLYTFSRMWKYWMYYIWKDWVASWAANAICCTYMLHPLFSFFGNCESLGDEPSVCPSQARMTYM